MKTQTAVRHVAVRASGFLLITYGPRWTEILSSASGASCRISLAALGDRRVIISIVVDNRVFFFSASIFFSFAASGDGTFCFAKQVFDKRWNGAWYAIEIS